MRGVIEGFYGHPWTHQQRLRLIPFLAERGMNTFVYTPKDDPLVRRDWRVAYDGAALARLRELIDACQSHAMRLSWCISPGLDMHYAHAADRLALVAKIRSVLDLGVRDIGLLFDDIPRALQHSDDRATYPSLAEAHATVANDTLRELGAGVRMTVCPTTYWGTGAEPYILALGASLDPRVGLYWTGRAICSPTIDLADAAAFARAANRPATYWDNYPVNDVAMSYELHIGPYQGRDPLLWRMSQGIVANGMELFEASLIPFATFADYLHDPERYDPEASWRQAIADVVGGDDSDVAAFTLFADNVRSSCLATDDAPTVAAALARCLFRAEQGDGAAAAVDLGTLADRLVAAAAHLLRGPFHNRALVAEARPWLAAFETGAHAVRAIADLVAAGRLAEDARVVLAPFQVALRRARVRVFGDVLEMTLSDLTGMLFRPGEVPQSEGGGS